MEPAKVHLNSDMETIRNHSIMKKYRKDTELLKEYRRPKELNVQPQVQFYILKRYQPTKKLVFVNCVWTKNCLSLNTKETTFKTKEMNFSLNVDTHKKLSLWTIKPGHYLESVCIRSFFLVPIFSCIWTLYEDLQSKSPYSCRIRCDMVQTNPKCEHFSHIWCQNIASCFIILIPLYYKLTIITNSRCFVSLNRNCSRSIKID